jgi:hypothetical protein
MVPAADPGSKTKLPLWAKAVGAVLVLLLVFSLIPGIKLRLPFTADGDGQGEQARIKRRPSEFLYLDNQRAAAYLAQLEGGVENSKRLSSTITNKAEASAGAGGFSFGGGSQVESFVERQVTPTAAAIFFQLLDDLRRDDQIFETPIDSLRNIRRQGEGAFVTFKTSDLRTPVYANPYLVVRQSGTLPALFPIATKSPAERDAVEAVRAAAKGFAHEVGPNPRIVFAIQREPASGQGFNILLPLHYRQLTDERSLIQSGGGRFTVVGKVVRIFDARGTAPYVDSPTRETWTQPLKLAPEPLVRRSTKRCERSNGKFARPQLRRRCDLRVLHEQTQITGRGAVIIPVAIYK